ncbi:11276_t:CDS:2 [Acaulospora colombiana]|uniref:11276_t:CDS:1 n=1 Tax=Acaulospora colombiana TaxID=27376 RepID=A0ACA9MRA1_9GLOM|nr:11276_t:CDS:2 [Acaulospora colombiana]
MASWNRLPPSSSPTTSPVRSSSPVSPSSVPFPVRDPFSALSTSRPNDYWKPPHFAKRERSPSHSPTSSPVNHKRVRREQEPLTSSPFGTRHLPATSSPFGTPPQYVAAVPRSPRKETAYEREERIWEENISRLVDNDLENVIDLSLAKIVRLQSFGPTSPIPRSLSLPTEQGSPSAARTMQRVSTTAISKNRLKFIPPAIGALKNLTELIIGGNEIEFLPSEIERLPLKQLGLHPNKWLPCPDAKDPHEHMLSPLETFCTVPPLAELCIRVLLSFPAGSQVTALESMPEPPSGVLPDEYIKYFSATCKKKSLVDAPSLDASLMLDPVSPRRRHEENDPQYDLTYSVCPNREHGVGVRKTFIKPAEIRYRWVKHIASADTGGLIPLQYRGCESGCLDFLEDAFIEPGDEPGDDDTVF